MKKKVLAVILAVVSVAALAACGSNGAAEPKADGSAATEKSSSTSADTTIKIGAKSFSESKILGELYALALEDAGYKVCLLYTSPSPRDGLLSRMPSSA